MKKVVIIMINFIYLFAFNFEYNKTEIINYNLINKNIPKGETGYIIQNSMIIGKVVSMGGNKVKYLPFEKLKNEALATPKVYPKKGDTIIFGLYNKRGLVIAPNQQLYIKTKKEYPNIKWINSDNFAPYFETKPTIEDFRKFCNDYNVGIIIFILDKKYIVDSQSFTILETVELTQNYKYSKPFFASYNKFADSIFSSEPTNWINYYKSLLKE
jgi:hypothetical protein